MDICLREFIDYQCMIISFACLGSFAAGVAVGMLIEKIILDK